MFFISVGWLSFGVNVAGSNTVELLYRLNIMHLIFVYKVYIRRAYTAYELSCIQHYQLDKGLCVVEFIFLLPNTHPNRLVFDLILHFIYVCTYQCVDKN